MPMLRGSGTFILGAVLAGGLAAAAMAQDMRGGGFVADYTAGCDPAHAGIVNVVSPARVIYRPGEWTGGATQLLVDFPDGAIHFTRGAPFRPASAFVIATARRAVSYFDQWNPRPRIRVVRRIITAPAGASMADAEEVFLELRIRNYWNRVGCTATLVATVAGPDLAPLAALAGVGRRDDAAGAFPPGPGE